MRSDTGAIATSLNVVEEARDASLKSWWLWEEERGWSLSVLLDAPDRESTALAPVCS